MGVFPLPVKGGVVWPPDLICLRSQRKEHVPKYWRWLCLSQESGLQTICRYNCPGYWWRVWWQVPLRDAERSGIQYSSILERKDHTRQLWPETGRAAPCMWLICSLSRVWLFATPWTVALQAPCPWDFPGKNIGVDCRFLLQGIFPTKGSNRHLCLCIASGFFTTEPPGKPV